MPPPRRPKQPTGHSDARARSGPGGSQSALRDRPAVVWLALAIVAAIARLWLPGLTWLTVHLVLLGGLTHSILVWSTHFSDALLKSVVPNTERRNRSWRVIGHITGTVGVLVGVSFGWWPVTVAGASIVAVAVIWHGAALVTRLRAALPGRFRITIRYYLAAAAALPVGATFGALLARGLSLETEGRLLVAHSVTMILGWAGLTVLGTLITLWPTMLRTRMDDRAEQFASRALPILIVALVITDAAACLGWRPVAAAGLLSYLAAAGWWARALTRPAHQAPPAHMSSWSVSAGLCWLVAAVGYVVVRLLRADSWHAVTTGYGTAALLFTTGFAAQMLIGALSYLVPMVLGGGAAVWRAGAAVFDRWAVTRLVIANGGLLAGLFTPSGASRSALLAVAVIALASFIPLMFVAIHAALAIKRERAADPTAPRQALPPEPRAWSAGQLVAGMATLAVIAVAATGWADSNTTPAGSTTVTPTGHTTTVAVTAKSMSFTPSTITVPAGDRLVIKLTNVDPSSPHDLVLANGADSGRLRPGQSATLDAGVIASSIQGWCSIVGHRLLGMTLKIQVTGTSSASSASGVSGATSTTSASVTPDSSVPASFHAVDPALPAAGRARTHKITLTITDRALLVAPGIRQVRWTFNGSVPGPTLHGRIGDTFDVTLINHASMGHSIDFHAGTLAPDVPMRTIAPGSTLHYRFTATRAGIWMYHCSTQPMSAHIAAGLHGAVVIDPPSLDAVARSYVLEQSEIYLSGDGRGTVGPVDADAANAATPSFVTFNGIARQYDFRPLTVRAGQRVRLWLLDAGPDRPMSFHVVGGQFDTTFAEGAYLLKRGKDAFGDTSAGAQSLSLQPGQGGFVEITFPQAGNYPFVTHDMADAEHGAHGIFHVVPAA